jgi:hypothetical protein
MNRFEPPQLRPGAFAVSRGYLVFLLACTIERQLASRLDVVAITHFLGDPWIGRIDHAGQYHAEPGGVNELSEIGGKRISVGSAFAQLAYGSLIGVAQEIAQQGSFQFIKKAIDYKELETFFA